MHESNTEGNTALPTDSKARKNIPIMRGVLDYFPAAIAEIARLSLAGNEKHNPGEPLHWARGKSSDHADCVVRHLMDRGTIDPEDGIRHAVKAAWRALAYLQEELEAAGAPVSRGSKPPDKAATDSGVGGGHEARALVPSSWCEHGYTSACTACATAPILCLHGYMPGSCDVPRCGKVDTETHDKCPHGWDASGCPELKCR